jgi:transcriptional regulator with XRE-family HTH domain
MAQRVPGLFRRRLFSGLTQEKLAEQAGIQRQTVVRLERGGEATISTIAALARVLKCQPSQLMGGDWANENSPTDP